MIENFAHNVIINPDEIFTLKEKSHKRVIFVDASFLLPTSNQDIYSNYIEKRIDKAVFFDIKKIKDNNSPHPNMLPNEVVFSKYISALGISNNDIIVIYGQYGMLMGPARTWWMLKGFGHRYVIVLNGGLPAWERDGFKTNTTPPRKPKESNYIASKFNHEMIVQMSDVLETSNNNLCPIIDARTKTRFSGKSPEPREFMRSGHIPNSMNIPCSTLINVEGKFKTKEELIQLFKNCNIDITNKEKPIISTCGSGITACALTLALHHMGFKNVAVYDGSWSEWGLQTSPTPIAKAT